MGKGLTDTRTESDRLLGRPIKLFTLGTGQSAKEITAPVLPAAYSLDWLAVYQSALEKNDELARLQNYYGMKTEKDWGKEGDAHKSAGEWNEKFPDLHKAVVEGIFDAFYTYGKICVDKLHLKENPLDREVLEPLATSDQIMNAITLMKDANSPLASLQSSLAVRDAEQAARVAAKD